MQLHPFLTTYKLHTLPTNKYLQYNLIVLLFSHVFRFPGNKNTKKGNRHEKIHY
jgi:hypothetical protein